MATGLLYATGRGKRAAYGATTRGDKEALLRGNAHQALLHNRPMINAARAPTVLGQRPTC